MKNAFYKTLFLGGAIIGIIVFLSACTPEGKQRRSERKLTRLVKKNPSLIKTDTIYKDTTAMVPKISDSVRVETPVDSAAVDSLTDHFKASVDSAALDSLNKGFKTILGRAGDMDTTIENGTTKIRIKKKKGVTDINIEVQPPPVKIKVPVIVNTVQPVQRLKFHERMLYLISSKIGPLGWCFVLIFLIIVVFWGIKKYILD